MKKLALIFQLVLILLSTSSCKFLFKTPVVEKIHDFRINSINPDKTIVEVSLMVANPNSYKLTITDLSIDVLNRDREKIGFAQLAKEVEIPKKKSNALSFLITLDTRATVKMINHADQKLFMYVGGKGSGEVLGTSKKFAFEEPYELDFRDKLENVIAGFSADGQSIFVLKRSYVEKLGVAETQVKVDFMVMNPYGLKYKLKAFPARIMINGKEAGSGDLKEPLIFDETIYSQEGSMIFRVSNWKSIVGAVKGAFKGEISYEVLGEVQVDAFGMSFGKPFSYKGAIPVSISDMLLN